MKPADDPTVDYKSLVQRGYDRCVVAYHEARKNEAGPELAFLTRRLEDGATVLDVGCGTGVPYTRALAQRSTVTGVDSSSEMIKQAGANVPEGNFIHGDIMSVEFPPSSFDGAVEARWRELDRHDIPMDEVSLWNIRPRLFNHLT